MINGIHLSHSLWNSKWTLNTQTYNLVRIHLVRDSHTYKYIGIDIDQWIRYIDQWIRYIYIDQWIRYIYLWIYYSIYNIHRMYIEYTYIYIEYILYRYISESVVIVVPSNTEKEI